MHMPCNCNMAVCIQLETYMLHLCPMFRIVPTHCWTQLKRYLVRLLVFHTTRVFFPNNCIFASSVYKGILPVLLWSVKVVLGKLEVYCSVLLEEQWLPSWYPATDTWCLFNVVWQTHKQRFYPGPVSSSRLYLFTSLSPQWALSILHFGLLAGKPLL